MRVALIVLIILFGARGAWAFDTGSDFLKECEPSATKVFTQLTGQEQLSGMACGGFIKGFVAGIRMAEAGTASKMICSTTDIEIRNALKISVAWMNAHRDQLSQSAARLLLLSLVDAFPCSNQEPPDPDSRENDRLTL